MQYGGAERVFEAIYGIFPEADIFCPVADKRIVDRIDPVMKLTVSPFLSSKLNRSQYRALIPMYPAEVEKFDFSGYDLVISDSSAWTKNIITPPGTVHVSYIYTPMRFAWSFFHRELEQRGNFTGFFLSWVLHFIRLWDTVGSSRVQYFLCDSRYVAKRIEKFYRRSAEVVYPFVDWEYFRPGNYKKNYFLLVSRFRPYKMVDLAIKAFNRTGDKLVIIGDGEKYAEYKALARNNIVIIRDVDDDHLREFYSQCRAFVFPQEEDFGITPLEVQSCGRPVIAYNKGGARETVLDGKTGIFFDHQTVDSLCEAIERFKKIENTFDKHKIREHAGGFTKDRFISEFRAKIDTILRKEGKI